MFKYLSILFLAVGFVFAGTDGTIRGQILDVNGEPVIGAQIFLKKVFFL